MLYGELIDLFQVSCLSKLPFPLSAMSLIGVRGGATFAGVGRDGGLVVAKSGVFVKADMVRVRCLGRDKGWR